MPPLGKLYAADGKTGAADRGFYGYSDPFENRINA